MTSIFVEDWASSYGSPYLVVPDDGGTPGVLVEDGARMILRTPPAAARLDRPIALLDGVRRGDATLYQQDPATGLLARGLAGSHACGAVLIEPGLRLTFGHERIFRRIIWGSGLDGGALPKQPGGWSWETSSIASDEPDAPLVELQQRMRRAEGVLAEELCGQGYLTIVDGPLTYVRSHSLPVVGYVKTHSRPLLPIEWHLLVPGLQEGQRTSLFALGDERYSCYLRLAAVKSTSGPWTGIVRIEVPETAGQQAAIELADAVAATIPVYAGVEHVDPRAPQNLQPVGALETHLRHLLGDSGLARRAVRDAVAMHAAASRGSATSLVSIPSPVRASTA